MNIKPWIAAARLRTLPLAFSVIVMGAALAYNGHHFQLSILVWSLLTTLFLQVLSNYANDYGDSQNGADNALRVGETRAVQSGQIAPQQMLIGIAVTTMLALFSGLSLLHTAFKAFDVKFFLFFALGLVCIVAAIKYTAGKNPYGYAGLGDVSVFLFFGLVGVLGSYFLHALRFPNFLLFMPAYSCGVFSVAVLNLNNMRDILPDTMAGKRTIPVQIGFKNAKQYHLFLLVSGLLSACLCFICLEKYWQMVFLLPSGILFYFQLIRPIMAASASDNLDGYLKKMAVGTLLFVALFGIAINI